MTLVFGDTSRKCNNGRKRIDVRKSRGRASGIDYSRRGKLDFASSLARSATVNFHGARRGKASKRAEARKIESKSSAWRERRREEKRRILVALAKRGKRLERNLFPTTRYISCTLGGPSIFTHGPNVNSNTRC